MNLWVLLFTCVAMASLNLHADDALFVRSGVICDSEEQVNAHHSSSKLN